MEWAIIFSKERGKVDINRKNRVETRIDETKTVDESFDFNGCIVVNVLFSTLSQELRFGKKSKNKTELKITGSVVMKKNHEEEREDGGSIPDKNDSITVDKINKDMKMIKNTPIEKNPFGTNVMFKFNPKGLKRKDSLNSMLQNKLSTNANEKLKKIKEDAPYKHSSGELFLIHLSFFR
jgi:hypothetical protein